METDKQPFGLSKGVIKGVVCVPEFSENNPLFAQECLNHGVLPALWALRATCM